MSLGHVAADAVVASSWLLALGWMGHGVAALFGMRTLPVLGPDAPPAWQDRAVGDAPDISVIVPACNEEEAIERTLRSLLASTGVRLEIIAVDDRSTDRTGARMAALAEEAQQSAHSLSTIVNRELPAGWLGKPHALQLGVFMSRAPWLLFTDADVVFAPEALALALGLAMAEGVDHLVLMPELVREGIGEAAMQGAIQALALWGLRLWKVRDPDARDFLGVGGFALIRKAALEGMGGMQRLRMEVIEDLSLGYLVKRMGYRSLAALGPGLVRIRWIRGFLGIVGNIEKNGFAAFRYRVWLAAGACLGLLMQAVLPLAVLAVGHWGWAAGLSVYAGIGLCLYANRRLNGVSPLAALLFAPSAAVLAWAFARSTILTLARDGVDWRGTHYPLGELRRHAVRWSRR